MGVTITDRKTGRTLGTSGKAKSGGTVTITDKNTGAVLGTSKKREEDRPQGLELPTLPEADGGRAVQAPAAVNTAWERSGASRNRFDAGVRERYAARSLQEAIEDQWAASHAAGGPAWAQEMAARYKPKETKGQQSESASRVIPVSPERPLGHSGFAGTTDWRGIPLAQSPDGVKREPFARKEPGADPRERPRSGGFGGGKEPVVYEGRGFTGSRQTPAGPTAGDWGGLAKDTVMAGVAQMSKAASSTLSAAEQMVSRPLGLILGNPELYKDAPFYKLDKAGDPVRASIQEDLAASAAKTGKAGELAAQFGPATVAALPQAALAYLTAGQSLTAQGTTAGLQGISTAAQLTGGAATANTILQSMKAMAADPSFQYSFLNTVGGEYQQALSDGVDPATAYAYAALSSLANSMVEVGGGIDTLPEALQGKSGGQLLEWVRSMFDEGKEEVVQGAISQMMQNGVYRKGNPIFSMTDEDAVVNPSRMGQDFLGGAVVGGVLGGGQMAVNKALDTAWNRAARRNQELEGLRLPGLEDLKSPQDLAGPQSGLADGQSPSQRTVQGQGAQRDIETSPTAQMGPESKNSVVPAPVLPAEAQKNTAVTETADKADAREVVAKLQASIPALQDKPIAATMRGTEFAKNGGKLTDQVGEFFKNLGNSVFRSGLGNIILDKRGVKSDIAHGIGRAKAITFAAIPDVIATGTQIDYQQNWKGRGYDTYVIAAPVDLAGQKSYVAAVIRSDAENRFYLHEVVSGDGELIYKIDAPAAIKTGVTAESGITGTAEASVGVEPSARASVPNGDSAVQSVNAIDGSIAEGRASASDGTSALSGDLDTAADAGASEEPKGNSDRPPNTDRPVIPSGSLSQGLPADGPKFQNGRADTAAAPVTTNSVPQAGQNVNRAETDETLGENIMRQTLGRPEAAIGPGGPEVRPRLTGGFSAENGSIAKADRRLLEGLGRITRSEIRVVSQEELDRITGQRDADGIQMGNRLYISEAAQRPEVEIAKHELTHRLQDLAPAEYAAYRDYVAGVYQADGSLEGYIQGVRESSARAGVELTEAEAIDEIAADYAGLLMVDERAVRKLAGEDRGLLERLLDGLREIIGKIRRALGGGADAETKELERAARLWEDALRAAGESTAEPEGSKTRFSITYDQENKPFVTVEEDILEGVPREDWVKTVKDNLRKKFPNGVTVGNSEIEINKRSRGEMTLSKYMKWLSRAEPQLFADKLRATNNTDEILRATTGWVNEALLHPRNDAVIDFARGTVQLRVGGNDYTAQVIVGGMNDGRMVLYDVINLEPASIQERTKKAAAGETGNPTAGTGGRKPATADRSISRSSQNVKPMRTFSEEIMAQIMGEDTETGRDSRKAETDSEEIPRLRLPVVEDADTAEDSRGRFSMKGNADIQKEVERLRRQNRRLREQMQRTDGARMNRESVERQARELLKEYGSRYDKATLYNRLEKLYDGIANQRIGESDMRGEARSIAEDILAESREQTNGLYEEYQGLRKELRSRGISIAPEYRADLESAGGYEGLRKQYFGRLRLSRDGTAVDRVYDDLAERYPELFPDDILHPADQLLRITEVLDDLRPVMGNSYESGMDQAAEYLAGELLERYYDTPERAPTFADRQARKMAEQRAEDRRHTLEAVKKERAKRETALRELQEKYRKADRKRAENQSASQRRETIRRHADRLGRMLLRPTDKRHVPEALRGAALELVRQIDTGSNYFLDPDTGRRIYTRGGAQIDLESPGQVQTSRTAAARELQAQYEKLAGEGGFTVDPDMGEYLDELANMGGKALGDMSKAELDTVWKVMRVVENCITKSDELLGRSRYATVSEMAERLREQNGGKKDRKNLAGLAGTVDQLVNMDMLTPETYFHKLGEAGEAVFKEMRSAADRQTGILQEGVERAKKLTDETGVDLRKAERELRTFHTEDGDLTLSTAQIMELYVLSKREQALEHIYVGGLKPAGARKGLENVGKAAPVKVTPADVAEIVGTLTEKQRKMADGLQAYLSGDLSKHGNDASMAVYGYEKFKEKNYWPIKVDRNQTRSDVRKEAESRTVAGYGMTKAVKPQARNAVMLRGILDSYTDHLNQMATYSGWLAASEDVNRVHNYVFTDGDGNADGTMKTLLEQVFGKGGNEYLDKLMADVAMGTKAGAEQSPMDRGLNQFKAAKVGGNLRVILQQPTAILRAGNMLDARYFLTGKNPMKGWETAKKYAPIAKWKDWGYFEMDTGRSLKELIAGEGGAMEAVKNKLMEPAGMADSVAWGHLWNAVESETAAKRPELRKGSEDFYRAAAERFGEIIDRTQVVDSVLHRTQIMRSANSLTRMSTSFMSEPSKIYNMVYRDLFDLQQAKSGAARAKAGKALARSTTALIVSFAVNAVAQSLPDMWRDRDRDKEMKEKFTDAYVSNFVENFDPVGYVPFLKDFESIVQGYSVDRTDLEGFTDVVNALGQMGKAMAGESKQSAASAALELTCKAGDLLGLPVSNIKRDISGIFRTVMQGVGNVEIQYTLDKLGLNPDKASATFYDDLYRAMGKDWEQYESIYQDMAGRGWDKEKLADNMAKRMAKEAGLEKPSSLPVAYSAPGEDLTFDQEIMRQLTGGGNWMDSLPEGALELARDLEQLEPEAGAERVTDMQKIRELRDSIWGDEVKDLTLSNILGEKDYDRMQQARKAGVSIEKWCEVYESIAQQKLRRTGKSGSPSQEDVVNALRRSGLTEGQKDVIWEGYGWKGERVG